MWGEYSFKPQAQESWEKMVKGAFRQIAAAEVVQSKADLRPRVFVRNWQQWVLLDTGAACTIVPKTFFPDAEFDPSRSLQAVNGETIKTFGTRDVQIKLGKTYTHQR